MRTVAWKGYLEGCRSRGYECVLLVQPCLKVPLAGPSDTSRRVGGSSSVVVHEEDAVADVVDAQEDEVADIQKEEEDEVANVGEAEEEAEAEYCAPHAQASP